MDDLKEIRKASELLYTALNNMLNGNSRLMDDVWSHSILVTTMHPVGGQEIGWDRVQEAWDQLARITSEGHVKLENQLIRAEGDMAYELGTERGQVKLAGNLVSLEQRVTNIYRREGSKWKVVHHHADISPQMVEVLQRLGKN
jgi:ketosteroid isomerase-like protein